jgi:hypothetical protein
MKTLYDGFKNLLSIHKSEIHHKKFIHYFYIDNDALIRMTE